MNLLIAASALAVASPSEEHAHHHDPQLGKVSFATTCNANADALVQRGLGWLHSFEYPEAAESFASAAAADPDCRIAYWGIAASYYHPLWAPPSAEELQKAQDALEKARTLKGGSAREQEYIAAIETFYRDAGHRDLKTRALAYADALKQLSDHYPDDREAAIFYALSLIAAGTMDKDPDYSKEKAAGAILNKVFSEQPDHPGVAHYLIHNFDYPALAEFALPAARRYAAIAPDSPHAQHMPSHIFVRLGLWDEAIKSNLAAEAAARAQAKAQGMADSSSERLHAMDYLTYAYLQTGQDEKAKRVLADLYAIKQADPPVFTVAYAATAMPVRYLLERRQWREAAALELPDSARTLAPLEKFQWGEAHVHFARAIGAARSGDAAAARAEAAQLKSIEDGMTVPPGTYDWRTQVAIERQIAEAWIAFAEERPEDSLRLMQKVADLDDATEKHPVTPGSVMPAREQLGELLFELGKPAEALSAYEQSLKRAPNRLAGLYGAARAAKAKSDFQTASKYYSDIVQLTKQSDASRAEVKEARESTAALAQVRR